MSDVPSPPSEPSPSSLAPAPPIAGPDVVRARERLGLTVDQFAAELGITPHVLEAWERGTLAVPRRLAQIVAYRLGLADREAALAESGLPECGWFRAWENAEIPPARGAWESHMHAGRRHAALCPICQARDNFLRERFPPLPAPPVPRWFELLRAFSVWLRRWPEWARPAIVGALLLGGLTLGRVLLALPTLARDPSAISAGLANILVGAAAGAAGGAIYGALRRVVVRPPR